MTTIEFLAKAAASPPGPPARLVRFYAPISDRRHTLEPAENEAITQGEQQWLPKIIQTDSTAIPEMMASPSRQATLAGLLGGAAGALGGAALSPHLGGSAGLDAAVGGIGLGGAAALGRYLGQYHRNEHLKETMRRLPAGATKRDYDAERMLANSFADKYGSFAKIAAAMCGAKSGDKHVQVKPHVRRRPVRTKSKTKTAKEQGDDSDCNRCSTPWPPKKAAQRVCVCGAEMRGAFCPACRTFSKAALYAEAQKLFFKFGGDGAAIEEGIAAAAPKVESMAAKVLPGVFGKAAPEAESTAAGLLKDTENIGPKATSTATEIGQAARVAAGEGESAATSAAKGFGNFAGDVPAGEMPAPPPTVNATAPVNAPTQSGGGSFVNNGKLPGAAEAMPATSAANPGAQPPPNPGAQPPPNPVAEAAARDARKALEAKRLGQAAHHGMTALGTGLAAYNDPNARNRGTMARLGAAAAGTAVGGLLPNAGTGYMAGDLVDAYAASRGYNTPFRYAGLVGGGLTDKNPLTNESWFPTAAKKLDDLPFASTVASKVTPVAFMADMARNALGVGLNTISDTAHAASTRGVQDAVAMSKPLRDEQNLISQIREGVSRNDPQAIAAARGYGGDGTRQGSLAALDDANKHVYTQLTGEHMTHNGISPETAQEITAAGELKGRMQMGTATAADLKNLQDSGFGFPGQETGHPDRSKPFDPSLALKQLGDHQINNVGANFGMHNASQTVQTASMFLNGNGDVKQQAMTMLASATGADPKDIAKFLPHLGEMIKSYNDSGGSAGLMTANAMFGGVITGVTGVADHILGMIPGLDIKNMSPIQKILTMLGGLGLLSGLLSGGKGLAALSGLAMAAGLFGDKIGLGPGKSAPPAAPPPPAAKPTAVAGPAVGDIHTQVNQFTEPPAATSQPSQTSWSY